MMVAASVRQTSLLSLFFKRERDWFFLAILWVYKKAAKTIKKEFQIGENGIPDKGKFDFDKVHLALACNYYEMGISCSEVGTLVDKQDPPAFLKCNLGIPQ